MGSTATAWGFHRRIAASGMVAPQAMSVREQQGSRRSERALKHNRPRHGAHLPFAIAPWAGLDGLAGASSRRVAVAGNVESAICVLGARLPPTSAASAPQPRRQVSTKPGVNYSKPADDGLSTSR
jgi:hypothetical protein